MIKRWSHTYKSVALVSYTFLWNPWGFIFTWNKNVLMAQNFKLQSIKVFLDSWTESVSQDITRVEALLPKATPVAAFSNCHQLASSLWADPRAWSLVFQSKHLIAFLEQPSQPDSLQVLKLALWSVTKKIKRFGPLQNHRINVRSLNFFLGLLKTPKLRQVKQQFQCSPCRLDSCTFFFVYINCNQDEPVA